MSSTNPYELLEVAPNATAEEIKAAYLRLAKQWHPDRFTGAEKAGAEKRFRELNEAYTAVKDPSRRASVPLPSKAVKAQETPSGPALQERSAKDWYAEAKSAFDQNDAGRALALVQYAIRQDNRQGEFYVLQGQALERMGDARKALKSYESALVFNPKDADTLIRMADLYSAEGMKARAEASIQAARRVAPNHRRFKAPKPAADIKGKGKTTGKGKGKTPAPQESLADQAKALWGRLTGKG
ncbi:MAG TPA: DnaJ domain-containing protein [Holophagaceae bacterium]|nr:DnaJ domain-containing protein [Holophagaceae bacterium]